MNILIDIGHPAHVHFFRNAINILQEKGYNILVTSRKKDITIDLLDIFGIEHICIGSAGKGLYGLEKELIQRDIALLKISKRFKPDILLGIGGVCISHVGKIINKPAIFFTDTENAIWINRLGFPFATVVCTPDCFRYRLGPKQTTYSGYHELAYLHPKRFTPDPTVLGLLGVGEEKYVIMRFVGWGASHDIGHTGMCLEMKRKAVKEFLRYAKVFISSEDKLPNDLMLYKIRIPFEKIHSALFYATLLFGESASMASECAILGTPAIFLDNRGRGYTDEQEKIYESVFNFTESLESQSLSIMKGVELLQRKDIKVEWGVKRQKLLDDKIDVTEWLVKFIERF
ncbi:DUF354 domain-containing protein [candidate division WOR-3 bacterium]|nr:DUF354 domain-containing protein [candidate division WOR-3 bacterium]